MRTITASLALLLSLTGVAAADVTGVYDVKFQEVSSNCRAPLKYQHGKLTISMRGNQLAIDIPITPVMRGIPAKNGKISAKSRLGQTSIEGMQGVFSVAGKVTPEGQLHLVMVGEYSTGGKPLCTQSWNISGPRSGPAPKR